MTFDLVCFISEETVALKLCHDLCEAVNWDQFRSQLAVESHGFLCLNSVSQSKAKSIVFVISKIVCAQYATTDSEWMIVSLQCDRCLPSASLAVT